ncbi:MAG: glycosyltransferase [Chloroflexia bacterium]|nr:glycosyltransferase [Chloroflexia bacterium]
MTYIIVTTIITLIYSIIIFSFIIGWIKIKKFEKGASAPSSVFTSIIIAVKNEEENILPLLESLSNQTIHCIEYEVIIVNDHSIDNTENLIRNTLHHNVKLLSLPKGQKGKKDALQYGINNSRGKLIVTTDADCLHHHEWLETIISFYLRKKPKLIIAPVLMQSNRFFEKFKHLIFSHLLPRALVQTELNDQSCATELTLHSKKIPTKNFQIRLINRFLLAMMFFYC